MNAMYRVIGISKQAVDQYAKRQQIFDRNVNQLLVEADELRAEHPGCGVEKMYYTLKPGFIGRDRSIELFMQLGYRVKKPKNYRRTTFSGNHHYPNLIKGLPVNGPSQVWQSDITYIEVDSKFYYAVFIVDVFTKQIVGYQVSDHMRATANMKALKMALKSHRAPKIHHSDRGSQYIYSQYIKLLLENNCTISMGIKAQDNAYAERVNGTIKEEYLKHWKPKSYQELKQKVSKAVKNYNTKRIHNNLKRNTPDFVNRISSIHSELEFEIFK